MKRFKIDENSTKWLVTILRERGQDVVTILDQGWDSWPDEEIIPALRAEGRILITLDVGIGNIQRFDPADTGGIVLLRPASESRAEIAALLRMHIDEILKTAGPGILLTVTPSGIRRRP